MQMEYTRRELTRACGVGSYCVLCNGQGTRMESIEHSSECPIFKKYVVSVTVQRVTNPVVFTAWKHYRWSWWSASGARYHVEDTGHTGYSLLLNESIDVIRCANSVEALRLWVEQNQGVL